MSIIKRKKQDKFFQMSNHAAQEDLTSLQSIGLLAYIISLPSDFDLYKTYLQKKFTRRTVDNAWSELMEKKYVAGFSCYIERKKSYFYIASDEQLNQSEFDSFVEETFFEQVEKDFIPKNLQPIKDNQFVIGFDFQAEIDRLLSDVQRVQYSEYSTGSTVPDEQIQMKDLKDIPQKHTDKDISDVNTGLIHQLVDSLFLMHGEGLFDKKDRTYFSQKITEEMTETPEDLYSYLTAIVQTIIQRRKKKLGLTPTPSLIGYNWLEGAEH